MKVLQHSVESSTKLTEFGMDGDHMYGHWPANSPDLNPIENLWHILRTNIKRRVPTPMRKEDLAATLQEEWAKLNMDMVNKLIESMPRRLQAVIDANGGSTKY